MEVFNYRLYALFTEFFAVVLIIICAEETVIKSHSTSKTASTAVLTSSVTREDGKRKSKTLGRKEAVDDDADDGGGLNFVDSHNDTNEELNLIKNGSSENTLGYDKAITFKKCCAKHESFNPRLKCIETKIGNDLFGSISLDPVGNKYPWFPSHILVNEKIEVTSPFYMKIGRVKPQYKSRPLCDESECIILQWNRDDQPLFFISLADGSMVELDNRNMNKVSAWPVDSYCLDLVVSSYSYYVALLCPCMYQTCIRKCCPRGFYYNVSSNICSQFEGLHKAKNVYAPRFYEGKTYTKTIIPHYLLRRMPPCPGRKIEMLNPDDYATEEHNLYIQKNGSLHLLDAHKWKTINNSRYCADIFIDYLGNRTPNALYCMHNAESHERLFLNKSSEARKFRGDGGFFTVNTLLFLVAITVTIAYE